MYDAEHTMTNHPPKDDSVVERFEKVREHFKVVAAIVDSVCPDSREKSLAFTNLEQALMWSVASVARNQEAL